jgi:hypothetical protein
MLKGLMLRSLQLPNAAAVLATNLRNAGVWRPFERKQEAIKWTPADLVGLGSWRDNNAPGAIIEEEGVLCCGMWWVDVDVGKQDVVHTSDDVCVVYGEDYEFAKLQRLAVVYYRCENEVEAALVWDPLWYERLVDEDNKDVLHDVRETVQVTLNQKRNPEWLNAALYSKNECRFPLNDAWPMIRTHQCTAQSKTSTHLRLREGQQSLVVAEIANTSIHLLLAWV